MSKIKRGMGLICLVSSASSVIMGATAANAAQDSTDSPQATASDGDIVVTAQRRSETLAKVPLTINAVSGESLKKAGVVDVQALQTVIPGLVFNNIGANAAIYLRGIGTRTAFAGLEPSIATYQDDRYIAGSQGNLFELMDVERVEVVKGPQGVLFGRNATAGAIRVITKDVEDDFGGNVQASYGNYNDYQVRGAVNLPLGDNAGLRISAMTHQHDGYEKNLVTTGRREMNDKNVSAIRAKLKVKPSDRVTLRLTLDASRQDDSSGSATVVAPPYNLHLLVAGGAITGRRQGEFASSINSSQKQRAYGADFRADVDLDFANFASMTTFGDNKTKFPFDYDGTNVVAVDVDRGDVGSRSFTQEIQLVSNSGKAIDWLVGSNYYHNRSFYNGVINTANGRVSATGLQTAWTNSYAAFGQLTWHLNDQIALIAGGRYTHDRIRIRTALAPGLINALPNQQLLPFNDSVSFSKFTPKAAIQWNIDSERMLYVSYSRGFKSGGFALPATPPNQPVKPEVLDNYEIGLKGTVGRILSFALSGFYYDYKDLQVNSLTSVNGTILQLTNNAATATVKGVEWESTLRPVRNFSITTALSYIDGKYDDYKSAVGAIYRADSATPGNGLGMLTGVPFDASGTRLLRLPKFSGSVTANYDIPVQSGLIQTSATYSFKSAFDFDFVLTQNTKNLRQPGYGLLSGLISYAPNGGKWKISVYGANLLDKKYTNTRQPVATGPVWVFADPQTYGIRIEANF